MTPRFLFDENLSPRIARALNELSPYDVASVVDHPELGRESDDVKEIIRVCNHEGWDLVLNDWQIRQKEHQRAALLESDLGAFWVYLGKNEEPRFWRQARMFVDRWPRVERYALDHDPPFSAMIHWRERGIEDLRRSS